MDQQAKSTRSDGRVQYLNPETLNKNWSYPPAIAVMYVAGLAHPDFLAEMDAIAVVPE